MAMAVVMTTTSLETLLIPLAGRDCVRRVACSRIYVLRAFALVHFFCRFVTGYFGRRSVEYLCVAYANIIPLILLRSLFSVWRS